MRDSRVESTRGARRHPVVTSGSRECVRKRRRHRWRRPQRPGVRSLPCEGRPGRRRPGETRGRRRCRDHRGALARLSRLERVLRRLVDASAGRAGARPEAVRVRGLDRDARLLRAVPRRHLAHALGRGRARRREHREAVGGRRRGLRPIRPVLRPRRSSDQGPVVRRSAEPQHPRPAEVGDDRRTVPQVERTRRPRGRPVVHDERRGFPRRVVRGRTGEGRARDAGDHRRVGWTDDARLGVRPDASLDRRDRRSSGRVGMGEGRHGRCLERDGASRRGRRRRDPHGGRGRSRRDHRERPSGRCRARRRLPGPGATRRVERASRDDIPLAGRRGTPSRRRRARRQAVPHAVGLGEAERRALGPARVPELGPGGRSAPGARGRVALDGVPRTGLGRREVRPDERAPVRRGRLPDGARAGGRWLRRAST